MNGRSLGRKALRLVGWLSVIAAVVFAWPAAFGGPFSLVVVSGSSMEPTMMTGDVAVIYRPGQVGVGDVVMYEVDVDGQRANVIHRLMSGDPQNGWVAQGDNKPYPDPWKVKSDQVEGRTLFFIPGAWAVLALLHNTWVLAVFAGVCTVLLVLSVSDDNDKEPVDAEDPAEVSV